MFFVASLLVAALGRSPVLTMEEFENTVFHSGKGTFIKFFSPQCGHCETMASDWDELASTWNDREFVNVVGVDCTSEGHMICKKYGIKTFPTLKYYAGSEEGKLKEYKGARSFESLDTFIRNTFKPMCDFLTKAGCLPEELKVLEKYEHSNLAELTAGYNSHQKDFYKLVGDEAVRELEFQKQRKELGKMSQVFDKLIASKKKKREQEEEEEHDEL